MHKKISIIVAIYNVEKYINRCIDSILSQTFRDFELILVDDGSTDRCSDICDEYQQKDSRIVVIHQKNMGLSMARNVGIDIVSGEYITFIDGDDFVHPKMLEILYENIKKTKAMVSVCNCHIVYPKKQVKDDVVVHVPEVVLGRKAVEEITNKRRAYMIGPWAKLYQTKLFDNIRFPKGKLYEDEYVTYKLLFYSEYVCITKEKLYYCFQRSGSIIHESFDNKRLSVLEALEDPIDFFRLHNEEKLANQAVYRYLFSIQIVFYKVKYQMSDNGDILKNLLVRYKLGIEKYYENSKKDIVFYRRIVLKLFSLAPNIYMMIIRIGRNFKKIMKFLRRKTL